MTEKTGATRRAFLTQLSGLGLLVLQPRSLQAQGSLPTRTIASSGESIPVVGLGSTKAVLDIPTTGTDPIVGVLRKLVELGGRVVDTAPRPEAIDGAFGRALQEPRPRERLFIATKINASGKEAGIAQMRQTQRLFGRRTLDLVQIESLTDLETQWPNLLEWKEAGEARHIGVTVSSYNGYERLESFMRSESPDFVHVNYSVIETRAEERLLPLARDRGMAVLTNRPFMNGSYFQRVRDHVLPDWAAEFDCTSWAQFSLKYILANPVVTCALTETTNPRHLEENVHAAFGRLPDEATRTRMRELLR
jgi:diketogulonate reductase-like aldo/keto reductase